MKTFAKSLLSAAALTTIGVGLSVSSVQAQVTSGQTVLGVTLVDVVAIVVQPVAALSFATAANYQDGVSASYPTHLTVTSNRAYDLKVKALTDLKAPVGILGGDIPIGNISVQVDGTTSVGTTSTLNLSTSDQTLAASAPGSIAKVIAIKYSTSGNNAAFARGAGVYTANLVYSITAL